jgi:hypothetical protein
MTDVQDNHQQTDAPGAIQDAPKIVEAEVSPLGETVKEEGMTDHKDHPPMIVVTAAMTGIELTDAVLPMIRKNQDRVLNVEIPAIGLKNVFATRQ